MEKKSEAFEERCETLFESEASQPMKILRTNHGKEYKSHKFVNFYESYEIKRQLTAACVPLPNEFCEKKNE